jgi:hypothetical protein
MKNQEIFIIILVVILIIVKFYPSCEKFDIQGVCGKVYTNDIQNPVTCPKECPNEIFGSGQRVVCKIPKTDKVREPLPVYTPGQEPTTSQGVCGETYTNPKIVCPENCGKIKLSDMEFVCSKENVMGKCGGYYSDKRITCPVECRRKNMDEYGNNFLCGELKSVR